MFKYFILWFVMLVIASANGIFREAWLKERLPDLQAHQVSTVILAILFTLFTYLVIRTWRPRSDQMAWGIGFVWLVLTLLFEFGFGHYVSKKPWSELLEEYNLMAGRIWMIIPLLILTLPYLFHRLLR